MPLIPPRAQFDVLLAKPTATIFIVCGDPTSDPQVKRVYEFADGYASGNQKAFLVDSTSYFSAQEIKDWSIAAAGWTVLGGPKPKASPLSDTCASLFLPGGQLDTPAVIDIFAAGDGL